MAAVQRRKRTMVSELRQIHASHTHASGAELIYGIARFVAPRTVEIELRDGGTRTIEGERVFLDLGSRAAIPDVPGLAEATPMTHVEVLDLDRLPKHLVVLGGGYVGLELSQAFRRFGSEVTVIEHGAQLANREDPDFAAALNDLFVDEGIEVVLTATRFSVFTAFGFEASELMVAMQTAMLGHLPYIVLRDAILTHPTMSEGLNQLLATIPARRSNSDPGDSQERSIARLDWTAASASPLRCELCRRPTGRKQCPRELSNDPERSRNRRSRPIGDAVAGSSVALPQVPFPGHDDWSFRNQ
jgi:pyruvate/2-oxoglutarate dehydrogenase complex dihydrolipoamide dehydrogenase (E3) component